MHAAEPGVQIWLSPGAKLGLGGRVWRRLTSRSRMVMVLSAPPEHSYRPWPAHSEQTRLTPFYRRDRGLQGSSSMPGLCAGERWAHPCLPSILCSSHILRPVFSIFSLTITPKVQKKLGNKGASIASAHQEASAQASKKLSRDSQALYGCYLHVESKNGNAVKDREACCAAVHGVEKSQTRLSN